MKLREALDIIDTHERGFMVQFDVLENQIIRSDHFPDKHSGEELIKSEELAWEMAKRFAAAVDPSTYINIYVINQKFIPVSDYQQKKIR